MAIITQHIGTQHIGTSKDPQCIQEQIFLCAMSVHLGMLSSSVPRVPTKVQIKYHKKKLHGLAKLGQKLGAANAYTNMYIYIYSCFCSMYLYHLMTSYYYFVLELRNAESSSHLWVFCSIVDDIYEGDPLCYI